MICPRCGYNNPEGALFCAKCAAKLSGNADEPRHPDWNFVKGPKWSDPEFSADSVSEDDIPEDFESGYEHVSYKRDNRRSEEAAQAAAEAAERARRAAEQAEANKPKAPVYEHSDELDYDEEYAVNRIRPSADAEDDLGDLPGEGAQRRSKSGGFLGDMFKPKKKAPVRDEYDEFDDGYDDGYEENYKPASSYKKPRRSAGPGRKNGLSIAIIIAAIVAAVALLVVMIVLIATGISSCVAKNNSPAGSTKAPVIEQNPDDDSSYFVTVYAKEGKVLIYETADGSRKEVTVPASGFVKFKVPVSSLMPTEPVDGAIYQATPKVYVRNDDGTETLIEGMEPVLLQVPELNVKFDNQDTIVSEDGKVEISGRIDLIATELTVNGEKVFIDQDGTFTHTVIYEDTGDYVIEAVGKLAGHQIYRHSFNVTVTSATSSVSLIQLPWEYGDNAFSQRIKNNVDTIEIQGRAPAGSTVSASCSSTNATLTVPTVNDDGSFTFNAKLNVAGDYEIKITCTSPSGTTSERIIHVQRAPEYATYVQGAWAMNYDSFAYSSTQAYNITGTVTEIIEEGDYVRAKLETSDGKVMILQYHNHYASAGTLTVGKTYTKIYGRPLGMNDESIPEIYVWFVDD